MSIQSPGLAIAAEAMSRLQENVAQSATRLAAASSPAGDTLDLSAEMIALLQARSQMAVVTEVAKTMNEMAGQSISLLA